MNRAGATVSAVVGLVALAHTLLGVEDPLNIYDEGVLLTNAELQQDGLVLHRDLNSMYPPGIYWLIDRLWVVFGTSIALTRYLGFALHVGIALISGRLAGRLSGRRFSLLAAALSLWWLAPIGVVAHAWIAALLAALAFVEFTLLARERDVVAWWLASGATLGAVGAFRHDLFVFLCVTGTVAAMACVRFRLPTTSIARTKRGPMVAGGACVGVVLAAYGPLVIAAGVSQVFHDLVWDQYRYAHPARVLPIPPMFELEPFLGGVELPALLHEITRAGILAVLATPLLAVLGWNLARRHVAGIQDPFAWILVGILAVAVLPQVLGRSDMYHAVYCIPVAITVAAAYVHALAQVPAIRRLAGAAAVVSFFVLPVRGEWLPTTDEIKGFRLPGVTERLSGMPPDEIAARRPLIDFIQANTAAREPIYVGSTDHSLTQGNDASLYFLARRPPATRWTVFDPGIISRREFQQEVIRELDRKKTRLVVLLEEEKRPEPNQSTQKGSDVLDEYLARTFTQRTRFGYHTVALRP